MTTLLVLGAADANARRIEALASARGLRVATTWTIAPPAWVLTASVESRREALARYRLPAFRVIQHPGLARAGGVAEDTLETALTRMAELGADEPALSPAGVALTRWLMPWIAAALERWLGGDVPDAEGVLSRKAEREALLRERPPRVRTPEEMQERADRIAARKAARKAAKLTLINPPRGPRSA